MRLGAPRRSSISLPTSTVYFFSAAGFCILGALGRHGGGRLRKRGSSIALGDSCDCTLVRFLVPATWPAGRLIAMAALPDAADLHPSVCFIIAFGALLEDVGLNFAGCFSATVSKGGWRVLSAACFGRRAIDHFFAKMSFALA